MRTGLNLVQTNILDADKKLEIFWAFSIDLGNTGTVDYYWSTKNRTWDGHDYIFKIKDFSNISMSGGNEVFGLSSPANITIQVINKDNTYTPSDFVGASITIRLIMKADLALDPDEVEWEGELEGEHICTSEILSWCFKVKTATTTYQILTLQCVDWLQEYLEGDYPNSGLINDIFPVAKMQNDNICIPKIWGEPFIPIRWARDDTEGFYILGNGDHTVSEMRSPKEFGSRTDFLESDPDNTFTLKTKTGTDGTTYDVVQFIVVDSDNDGTCDSNAMFGPAQGPYYDVPCRYSKAGTIDTTNPIEIIKEIIIDFGVPNTLIDTTSYDTAVDLWDSRGLKFDVGLFYKQPRKKLLAKLLTMCNSRLIVRDKLYFKVNSTASQHTINNSWVAKPMDVGEGYFRIRSTLTSIADGGYVTYAYKDGTDRDPIDQLVKTVVPTNGLASIAPADITIEAEYISDSTHAQKIGIMGIQRMMTKEHEITCTLKAKCLEVECGDIVSIEGGNYGAIGSNYDVLITDMSISRSGQVDVVLAKYKDDLDDWGDIVAGTVNTYSDDTLSIFSPVISGPVTPGAADGKQMNIMYGIVRIGGETGHILLNSDSSYISIGSPPPTAYGNYEGVWLGIDSTSPKLSLYKDANNYLHYDPDASPSLIIKSELYPTGNSDAFSILNNTLDNVSNGIDYGRVAAGDLDVDGHIILTAVQGDLDDIADGDNYAKVLLTDISAGHVLLSACSGDLDDIADGTYGKVLTTDISSGHIVLTECVGDIDDIDDGSTYAKVLSTHISSGVIKLSSEDSVAEGTLSGNSRVILSTSGLSCFNADGTRTIEIKTDGDVKIGNYDGNNGIFYDNSEGDFIFKTNKGGNFQILGGGDIQLTGSDTDPGKLIFKGTDYDIEMGSDATGDKFIIQPTTAGYNQILYLGSLDTWWGSGGTWLDIELLAYRNIYVLSEYSANFNAGASALSTSSTGNFMIAVNEFPNACSYSFRSNVFYPTFDKEADLGKSDHAWDDAYADDFNNVADFYHMDDKKDKDGNISTLDDIETIKAIKPSNEFDPRTGLRLIDDDTIPEFLLSKDKKTGEILYDHYDNITYCEMLKHNSIIKVPVTNKGPKKPYLSLKTMISLCMGAIRQLSYINEELKTEICKINKELKIIRGET